MGPALGLNEVNGETVGLFVCGPAALELELLAVFVSSAVRGATGIDEVLPAMSLGCVHGEEHSFVPPIIHNCP